METNLIHLNGDTMIRPKLSYLSLWRLIVLIVLVNLYSIFAQQRDPEKYKRWNELNINKVSTVFDNVGMLCDGDNQNYDLARVPSFEYPTGSGIQYGTCVAVVIGAPFPQDSEVVGGVNPNNYPYCDGAMDEGPADFWNNTHFAAYPEFVNPTVASVSTDKTSWPDKWPEYLPNYYYYTGLTNQTITNNNLPQVPIKLDPNTGWPGFGPNGEQICDQGTFNVCYDWGGPDQIGSANPQTRWLRTQMIMRSMAWKGTLYQDFIVWVFIVRNPTNQTIKQVTMGIHDDMGFFPAFSDPSAYDADRAYYDPSLQLAYGSDDDGFEVNPKTGADMTAKDIGWGGVVVLRMPGGNHKVRSYDATHYWIGQTTAAGSGGDPEMYYNWNLRNGNDPEDSDNDGIDDDYDHDGTPDTLNGGPNYYVGSGADALQVLGSHAFDMKPGEMDTLIFATVFGMSEKDIKTHAKAAIALYHNNWKPTVAPPAPTVEAFGGDGKVVLVWGTQSEEQDKFEGYKIYRSQDNGQTWGSETFNDFSGGTHYVPLAQFDRKDGIQGNYKTLPEYAWFNLGEESGLPERFVVQGDSIRGLNLGHTLKYFSDGDSVNVYIDRTVLNGVNYRYYVAAYDTGNGIIGPLENSAASQANVGDNTVSLIPQLDVETKNLDQVRVVPNPYVVSTVWETGWKEHIVQFTGLPQTATIKIFNSSGELVRTLRKDDNTSIAKWDLKNENNQLIAPGVYFYYLSSNIGSKTGKIFIIL